MLIQKITRISILTALSCVLRYSMGAFPNIKPITALFFVLVLYIGLSDAILVSALTMIVTGMLMGFSIIIIGQIMSYAIILALGSLVFKFIKNIAVRTGAIFILTMCYGFFISMYSAYLFGTPFLIFWLNGLTFDLAHAISTTLFFPILLVIFKRVWKTDTLK